MWSGAWPIFRMIHTLTISFNDNCLDSGDIGRITSIGDVRLDGIPVSLCDEEYNATLGVHRIMATPFRFYLSVEKIRKTPKMEETI